MTVRDLKRSLLVCKEFLTRKKLPTESEIFRKIKSEMFEQKRAEQSAEISLTEAKKVVDFFKKRNNDSLQKAREDLTAEEFDVLRGEMRRWDREERGL